MTNPFGFSRTSRRKLVSSLFVGFCGLSVLLALMPLAFVLFFVVSQGIRALNFDFFTQMPKPVGEAGSGGSIPLLRTLQQAAPNAEFILWGAEDTALSRIHASDESVDPDEIERLVVAQALLLQRLTEKPSD